MTVNLLYPGAVVAAITVMLGVAVAQDRPVPDVSTMSVDDVVKLRQEIMKEDGEVLKGAMSGADDLAKSSGPPRA